MDDSETAVHDIQVIEYFAGVGRIARVSRACGLRAVAYDLEYGKHARMKPSQRNPLDMNSNAGFVLAVKLILRGRFNELVAFFGICCSSFVPVNRGTGHRDMMVPEGDEHVASVRRANKLLSRSLASYSILCGLLLIVFLALGSAECPPGACY